MTITIALLAHLLTAAFLTQPAPALRIVVIEGEDAVNVIQQKTAVAPVVEVRDRNDQPVAGAIVTFTIGGNTASFAGGVQTITVPTNAGAQAAAAAITPLSSGAMQIQVAAAFQGQTIAATIAQTNVLTAAQAASAAGASSAGASTGSAGGTTTAAGGAAGGGGGVSGTTLGIVGAAVGGGALAATQVGGGSDGAGDAPAPTRRAFSGSFSMLVPLSFQGCTRQELWTGTLRMLLETTEPLAGTADITGSLRVEAVTCSGGPQLGFTETYGFPPTALSGTAANLGFTIDHSNTFPPEGTGSGGLNTIGFRFSGAFNGTEITGTLNHTRSIQSASGGVPGTGAASANVTLR